MDMLHFKDLGDTECRHACSLDVNLVIGNLLSGSKIWLKFVCNLTRTFVDLSFLSPTAPNARDGRYWTPPPPPPVCLSVRLSVTHCCFVFSQNFTNTCTTYVTGVCCKLCILIWFFFMNFWNIWKMPLHLLCVPYWLWFHYMVDRDSGSGFTEMPFYSKF